MDKLTVATSARTRPAKGGLSHLDANLRRLRAVFHFMEVGMGISLKELKDNIMLCPIGGVCRGAKCMVWRWDNDGLPHYQYLAPDAILTGEWVKDGDPNKDEDGEQRWVHPSTGHCGLVKG